MDHLWDEWKHSQYFVAMFSFLWARLSIEERDFCAAQLPMIIRECFRLDENLLKRDFYEMGIDENIAEIISAERSSESENRARAKNGATATLHALRNCSFFDDPRYITAFAEYGLIEPDDI